MTGVVAASLPSGGTIDYLMRSFAVPETKRNGFTRMMRTAWGESWRGVGIYRALPRSPRVVKVLERAGSGDAASACAALREDSLHAQAAANLLAIVVEAEIEECLSSMSIEARRAALEKAKDLAVQLYMSRGRTPGTTRNPAFDLFVRQLYIAIAICGGHPGKASKKGADPVNGPFFRVLGTLQKSGELPPKLIPSEENARLAAFRRAERGWCDLSNTCLVSS